MHQLQEILFQKHSGQAPKNAKMFVSKRTQSLPKTVGT